VVTAIRTVATVAGWAVAITTGREAWLITALLCYWIGDISDGILARWSHWETRTGAVLDVLADRLSVCLVVVTYVTVAAVYRLNWSPPAKVTNTSAVVLVWLVTRSTIATTVLAAVIFGVKSFSALRLARLPVPRILSGCAVLDVHAAAANPATAST
jgi:CDP-diacylglycerol--glycerol-3-phosphate 3-phosphatidyltransferase